MGGGERVAVPRVSEGRSEAAFNASLLQQLRSSSHIDLRAHAPAVRKLHLEQGRFFHQAAATKEAYAMPEECQTGVAGTAEYGNQGYSLMDGEKESVRFRKRIDGSAIPAFPPDADVGTVSSGDAWRPRQFEETVMEAHDQLDALGRRVLDGIEAALRAEAGRGPAAGFLSGLLDYGPAAGDTSALPGGAAGKREAERSNVTIGITRYMRKGEGVSTRPDDSGEVNKSYQRPGEGLPVGAHTDASILTMVISPSQLGLEVFNTPHPMTDEHHRQVLDVYFAARKGDGEAGGGAAREGSWLPGFAEDELDTSEDQVDYASPYSVHAVDADEPVNIALMLGDMAVFASGGVLPSASHRVTCAWPTDVDVRFALVFSM
jgi:isopenicillin N synthase-like dioxygenase